MANQLDAVINQLNEVRAQKARILDDMDRLNKELKLVQVAEQKLVYVVDVVRLVANGGSVLAVLDSPGSPPVQSQDSSGKDGKTLEKIIGEMFTDEFQGYSSTNVVDYVAKHSDAKKESITSTLSRMVTKGTLKRDGKLYFKAGGVDESGQTQQPSQGADSEDTKVEIDLFKGSTPSAM